MRAGRIGALTTCKLVICGNLGSTLKGKKRLFLLNLHNETNITIHDVLE